MKKLTRQLTIDFHKYMARKFGAKVASKKNTIEMQGLAWALDLMGITDKKTFTGRMATTIGNRIYLPYEPGEGTIRDWARQIRVMTHECIHVRQWRDDSRFSLKYLLSKERRAHYEERALRATLETVYWCYGYTNDGVVKRRVADIRKYYRVRKADANAMLESLLYYNRAVSRGGVATKAGKTAVRWLNKRVK